MTGSSSSFPANLPILDGKNWDQWCVKMKVIFGFQEVQELITNGLPALKANANEVQQATHKQLKKKDCKAQFLIHQCVDSANFEKISATSMMDKESIGEFFTRLPTLVNSMKNYGEQISDQQVVEKVLRTLTPQFDHIVAAIKESKYLSTMSINELQNSLEAHEQRLKERKENKVSQEQALYAKNQWNKGGNGKGKWKGEKNKGKNESSYDQHHHSNDQSQGDSSNKGREGSLKNKNHGKKSDKSKIQCYSCDKWGHYASECRSKGDKQKQEDEAHHARHNGSDSDDVLLMLTKNYEGENSNIWYLDTRCSNHMTCHRDWLLDFDEKFKSTVKFADNITESVEGKGKVMVIKKNGNHTFVTDVLYVPTMKHNLLSLGQLLEKGFTMSMQPEELWTCNKPSVKHLRIFGSLCYRHIPDEMRRKLDDKCEHLILIGYDATSAYKMYNPKSQKVIINRDGVVDEKS
ncbi:hypothetical protein TSUD_329110 [Trifolium subterraneum]|uniref:CCHC-type domain-containing protein n=1 Tax=Trifolium subterraneum TaxID=3900 RepID=A0A2Z6LSN3_TRISU|nr:hypothetical protein TSUD_329110 [Trifolium subterraneum]